MRKQTPKFFVCRAHYGYYNEIDEQGNRSNELIAGPMTWDEAETYVEEAGEDYYIRES